MARAAARRKQASNEPGYDGAVLVDVEVNVSHTRRTSRQMRCRPGSFEWRYGRKHADTALYHAGVTYATLWETAGTADDRSPNLAAVGGGAWKGLPDARMAALDELRVAFAKLGQLPTSRLTAYCVRGETVAEMAKAFDIPGRDMAAVVHMDLTACALHFRFL